jgi:Mg2+ and Co2+ transporter CorA
MFDLLESFTPVQIFTFIILFAIAFKQTVDFIDWLKEKVQNRDESVKSEQDEKETLEQRIEELEKSQKEISEALNSLKDNIDMLIKSDKDSIKAYITKEHHYFCYKVGWIDDYSLDCLERRFDHYVEEKGNSFIESLMDEVRALPKKPMQENKESQE